ncbi:hypothetical protein EV683_12130 [Crenobacter luteus]|uniref:hypothetical protein n=1 Tax=Crenobacter luteus TaxID=1452487 RepID=UPI00104B4589|nr:hypothetical protein [Crenobacter luteus]TCP10630.1 hypothetical protein EV683_12130 [Crenobacter luteus]
MKTFPPCCVLGSLLAALAALPTAAAEPASLEEARAQYWKTPHDPAAINALALRLLEAGDAAGARLLLYRAVRIAPDRVDILANLARLEAGSRAVGAMPGDAAGLPDGAQPDPALDPPPLWPARR